MTNFEYAAMQKRLPAPESETGVRRARRCLDQQIGHDGATWLDRERVSRQRVVLAGEGFGREVKAALDERKRALVLTSFFRKR
jgi:hypothetical protein